jgi:hypothetical protein
LRKKEQQKTATLWLTRRIVGNGQVCRFDPQIPVAPKGRALQDDAPRQRARSSLAGLSMPHTLSLLLAENARPVRANSDNIRSNALIGLFGTVTRR